MTLFRRQAFEYYDDRSPFLSFVGHWTHRWDEGAENNLTSTSTPESCLSFTFSGASVAFLLLCWAVLTLPRKQGPRRGSMVIY